MESQTLLQCAHSRYGGLVHPSGPSTAARWRALQSGQVHPPSIPTTAPTSSIRRRTTDEHSIFQSRRRLLISGSILGGPALRLASSSRVSTTAKSLVKRSLPPVYA